MASPAAASTSADGAHMALWVVEGSPLAHLGYVITLCLLGATLAIVRDAQGEQRTRLWRVFGILVVVAVVMLGLSILPEPVRTPLNLTA